MNRADKIFIALVVIFTISLYASSRIVVKMMDGERKEVVVYYQDNEFARYDLYTDQIFIVPGNNGDITVQIEDERVRVVEETSPLNICSIEGIFGGWKSEPNDPIVCLPNETYIMIESTQEPLPNDYNEDSTTR